MAARQPGDTVEQLLVAIDQALEVAQEFTGGPVEVVQAEVANPESLLAQCIALCTPQPHEVEPVRTVHQMACTGGTLFAKCIAAMPNVQLLSEVDPLSRMLDSGKPEFCPTDMVRLMRQATRGASERLQVDVFLAALDVVHKDATSRGERLVLRDHAHSQYCFPTLEARPTLRSMVAERLPVKSLLLVRHPLDSYMSLHANGWVLFEGGLEEYARRYTAFLDDHAGVPVIRYEDFVRDPMRRMREACDALHLAFADHFTDLFGIFRISGDSGRSGGVIAHRPRRPVPEGILAGAGAPSDHYAALLKRLDYDE